MTVPRLKYSVGLSGSWAVIFWNSEKGIWSSFPDDDWPTREKAREQQKMRSKTHPYLRTKVVRVRRGMKFVDFNWA